MAIFNEFDFLLVVFCKLPRWLNLKDTARFRGVFSTLQNVYDEEFLKKNIGNSSNSFTNVRQDTDCLRNLIKLKI